MAEGTPENKVTYFTVQGHSHDGVNSTKIDFSGYDLFDFISEGDLERLILTVVNDNPLNPKGGIIIEPGPGGGDGVFIGPAVPGPATGLASTCSINEAGDTVRNVTWDPIPRAVSYIIQLHRSIDSGSNYLKIQEVETDVTSHAFEAAPMANVTQTKYKLIVNGKSGAGISGVKQEISNISPCVDSTPPAGPKFEDAGSPAPPNLFVSFRGFLARLQEQTEADTKWGIGQFEYSVSESIASEGQWVANEADNGRQTGRVLSVTGLATGTPYYLRVRAYDNSNNYSPWTYWNGVGDDGDATMSNADSFTPTEITGTEIGVNSITTGHIQANTIVAGDIAAHTITAGQIGANAITSDRIETNFALVNHTISSQSYSAGSVGWMIDHGGTAEFNGAVTARNLSIVGKSSDNFDCSIEMNAANGDTLFKVDPNGDVFAHADLTLGDWTTSGNGLNWDQSAGELSIRGVIGIVGGWTIDANSMYIGGKTTSGFASAGITLNGSVTNGSLHSKNFYIDSGGDAYFRGLIEASTIQTGSSGPRIKLNPVGEVVPTTTNTGYVNNTQSANTLTTVELKAGASSYDNYYNGWTLTLTAGPGSGSVRTITDYVGSTKVATVDSNFSAVPTTSTQYRVEKIENMFLQGFTGDAEEDYSGFLYFYHDLEDWSNASSEHWGRVALSAPRYSATFAYAGFNFKHSNLGKGELSFGLPHHADQFVIADAGSSSTPTNTFNRGGITIVSGTPASTNNTLYADGTTLKWHGAAIGGGDYSWDLKVNGGSVIEITDGTDVEFVNGSNVTISRNGAAVTINAANTQLANSVASPIALAFGVLGFDETAIGGTGHSHSGAFLNGSISFTAGNTINSSSAGGLVVQGSAGQSGNLRANNGNSKGVEVQSGGSTKIYHSTTAYLQTSSSAVNIYKDLFPTDATFSGGSYYGLVCGDSTHAWEEVYTRSLSGTSDVNLKTDIQDATYGLDFVKGLRPRTFKWKEATDSETKEVRAGIRLHHGFIAQEVEALLGDDAASMGLWSHGHQIAIPATNEEEEDIEESWNPNLRYLEFIPILTKAIQELSNKLDAAEARLAALEA